jgi:hypothetical protein
MPGPREEAVLYVLFFMRRSAGFWGGGGAAKDHTMLISVSWKIVAFYDGGAPGILYEL